MGVRMCICMAARHMVQMGVFQPMQRYIMSRHYVHCAYMLCVCAMRFMGVRVHQRQWRHEGGVRACKSLAMHALWYCHAGVAHDVNSMLGVGIVLQLGVWWCVYRKERQHRVLRWRPCKRVSRCAIPQQCCHGGGIGRVYTNV
jgi:hypothetical protein